VYQKINKGWLKHWDFELTDLVCIEMAFFLAYYLRHRDVLAATMDWYAKLGIVLLCIQCLVMFFANSYKSVLQRGFGLELSATIQHVTIVEVLFITFEFIMKETAALSRYVILVSWGLSVIFCYIGRLIVKAIVRNYLSSEKRQSRMLVITNKERAENCMRQVLKKKFREYRVVCMVFLEEDKTDSQLDLNMDIIYGDASFWEYVRTHVVDRVYIDTFQNKEQLNRLVEQLLQMGITTHIGMHFLPEELPNQFVEKVGAAQVITTSIKTARAWEIAAKRVMDILGAIVGLIFMGIAFIIVAPIIKKQSPGPVFFKQERVGRNGRVFNLYKFRSMNLNAEEHLHELMEKNEMKGLMFKMEDDPRIIGYEKGPQKSIGYFIRRTSIDELPQFWNVLKGDMSLVGTRPPTLKEYEQYDCHHKIRLSIKPGITGMWQTGGRSNIFDFEEIVKLDTRYIENWSLGLDIKLIFKTVLVVLGRVGAK